MRLDEWAGETVYHCHILYHEDTGMMANSRSWTRRQSPHRRRGRARPRAPFAGLGLDDLLLERVP
ncbi:multicopper oxidase domain-containing protein [Nannocystis pusilla]|uniref:multicopper oxidase domain-containing protein n=1 Tax=Nannocystis pusilla TaxID=889268 RepID=UPI003B77BD34